jgi:UDP:flavonoid glycosyltransferase YjiC (YdhE family)
MLGHPKLRGFVSHGGLNSIQEATYYGVPMIVLPLFVDQDYNAYRIEAQKVGFRLEIRGMTFSKMDDAITKILTDNQ